MDSFDVATTPAVCVVTLNLPFTVSTEPTMVWPSLRPMYNGPGAEMAVIESHLRVTSPALSVLMTRVLVSLRRTEPVIRSPLASVT